MHTTVSLDFVFPSVYVIVASFSVFKKQGFQFLFPSILKWMKKNPSVLKGKWKVFFYNRLKSDGRLNQPKDSFQILFYFLLCSNFWTRKNNLADKQSLSSQSESSLLSFLLDFSFFFLRLFDELLFLSNFGDGSNNRLPELKERKMRQLVLFSSPVNGGQRGLKYRSVRCVLFT